MRAALFAAIGGAIGFLAFPPYGPGILIFVAVGLFLAALRIAGSPRHGLLLGAVYGLVFFGGLMWWMYLLEFIALILIPALAAFFAVYGYWLTRCNDRSPNTWLVLAVGGWAVMELVRYRFPFGGIEWGANGYALSDQAVTRWPASALGTSGLTVLVVLISALALYAGMRQWHKSLWSGVAVVGLALAAPILSGALFGLGGVSIEPDGPQESIIQGSTPCPFEKCVNERLGTFEQHLALTESLEPGDQWVTVWPEGSTGSSNADPVQNPAIGEAISDQAARLASWFVVGGDRPISAESWINANVYFNPEGEIVGEYRKQHGVPFGEYIPFRPLFEWIPALDRVPRDMIPGDGPLVVDTGEFMLGSVISFEGGFSRYALQNRRNGADIIVVNTNNASYGPDAPVSDQFIGMTRMRAVENGVPLVHAAVTGKSALITSTGRIVGETGLGVKEVITGNAGSPVPRTVFSFIGDSVMVVAALVGILTWGRTRRLVGLAR